MECRKASIFLLFFTHLSITSISIREIKVCENTGIFSLLLAKKVACYGELGCFSACPPFYHKVYRPISLLPQARTVLSTRFILFTRKNSNRGIFIKAGKNKTLLESPFNPTSTTRIIVHGLFDNFVLTRWTELLRALFLKVADENIIFVDWSSTNLLPYSLAVANTRLVGAEIAHLIQFIQKIYGTKAESFHIIGHSLGAHAAGYAGERLRYLGRITGLDPAGPFYEYLENEVVLDPSDALFVDIIHTNPGQTALSGYGIKSNAGHADFWPEGGNVPGCNGLPFRPNATLLEITAIFVACRHLRSIEYMLFSFNQRGCLFVGALCSSWMSFRNGECDCGLRGERCSFMGAYSPKHSFIPGYNHQDRSFFLRLGPQRPYCVHQYQVILYFTQHHKKKLKSGYIFMDMYVSGDKEKILYSTLNLIVDFNKGVQVTKYLITSTYHIGNAENVVLRFNDKEYNSYYSEANISVEKIRFTYLYPLPRNLVSRELCKASEQPGRNGKKTYLTTHLCWRS